MKIKLTILLCVATALPALAAHRNVTPIAAYVDSATADCDNYHNQYNDEPTQYAQEQRTIARSSIAQLAVRPPRNGGVRVEGWNQADISVIACKSAAGADAQQKLAAIHMVVNGGEVTAEGPASDHWGVMFVVRVPSNINLEVEAHNGPVSLRNVNGTVHAQTTNGPVSVKNCSGQITAEAQNGPVSLEGSSGDVKLRAQNGPISVRLSDQHWNGAGLDVSTHNGPLDLRMPSNFESGVEVVSDGHGPFSCDACGEANRTWDNEGNRRARLGSPNAPVVVHMSTVNGPVHVRASGE